MRNAVAIIINGVPKSQLRPRFFVKSGCTYIFDPCSVVKKKIQKQIRSQNYPCLTCPIAVIIKFFMPIAPSTSKKLHKQMLEPEFKHTKKPDIDNLYKLITDAMTGIIYHDDSQIFLATVEKIYSDTPRTEVSVLWD